MDKRERREEREYIKHWSIESEGKLTKIEWTATATKNYNETVRTVTGDAPNYLLKSTDTDK